jgi:uncharacterized membrane protein
VTFLVRVALIICISLFIVILVLTPFTEGNADNNIEVFFFFSAFYSVIWVTIPSIFLLAAITLDNRYRTKARKQLTRIEVKLLIVNIIIILIAAGVIGLIRLNN